MNISLGTAFKAAVCVLLQALFQHIEDRLQASAGFIFVAEKRMKLGAHLRRP
jgi:ATP-binding cassette subfamily B protein